MFSLTVCLGPHLIAAIAPQAIDAMLILPDRELNLVKFDEKHANSRVVLSVEPPEFVLQDLKVSPQFCHAPLPLLNLTEISRVIALFRRFSPNDGTYQG